MRARQGRIPLAGMLAAVVPLVLGADCGSVPVSLDQSFSITVQTKTTGEVIPDGFTAVVKGQSLQAGTGGSREVTSAIGPNDSVRFPNLGAGEYDVSLRDLPANCQQMEPSDGGVVHYDFAPVGPYDETAEFEVYCWPASTGA